MKIALLIHRSDWVPGGSYVRSKSTSGDTVKTDSETIANDGGEILEVCGPDGTVLVEGSTLHDGDLVTFRNVDGRFLQRTSLLAGYQIKALPGEPGPLTGFRICNYSRIGNLQVGAAIGNDDEIVIGDLVPNNSGVFWSGRGNNGGQPSPFLSNAAQNPFGEWERFRLCLIPAMFNLTFDPGSQVIPVDQTGPGQAPVLGTLNFVGGAIPPRGLGIALTTSNLPHTILPDLPTSAAEGGSVFTFPLVFQGRVSPIIAQENKIRITARLPAKEAHDGRSAGISGDINLTMARSPFFDVYAPVPTDPLARNFTVEFCVLPRLPRETAQLSIETFLPGNVNLTWVQGFTPPGATTGAEARKTVAVTTGSPYYKIQADWIGNNTYLETELQFQFGATAFESIILTFGKTKSIMKTKPKKKGPKKKPKPRPKKKPKKKPKKVVQHKPARPARKRRPV